MAKTCAIEESQCCCTQRTEGVHAQGRHSLSVGIFRLFGVDRGLEEPLSSIQRINNTWATPEDHPTFLETHHAKLEAERKKDQTLTSWRYKLI